MHFETVPCRAHPHMAMEMMAIDSCVNGHHSLKPTWIPTLHEELRCCKDVNLHNQYAVAVVKGDTIVGHVPWEISAASYLFLEREESSIILANHVHFLVVAFSPAVYSL